MLKVGCCQQKLGALERDFALSATAAFAEPMKKFIENEMKVIFIKNNDSNFMVYIFSQLFSVYNEREEIAGSQTARSWCGKKQAKKNKKCSCTTGCK